MASAWRPRHRLRCKTSQTDYEEEQALSAQDVVLGIPYSTLKKAPAQLLRKRDLQKLTKKVLWAELQEALQADATEIALAGDVLETCLIKLVRRKRRRDRLRRLLETSTRRLP